MRGDSTTISQTSGAELTDGRVVDLINDGASGRLRLIWRKGTGYHSAERIEIGDGTFIPLALDPGVQRAIPLPTQPVDYRTTEALFAQSVEILTRHGLPEAVATPAIHFAFASWFPETGAPCLTVTGPIAEATLFMQSLGCLVRRGLLMKDYDSHGFRKVIEMLHPTLLIDGRFLTRRSLAKLSAASGPHAFVAWKASIVDVSFARSIYLGARTPADVAPDFSLHIHIPPSRRAASLLDDTERGRIIAAFQPRFLDYRLRNLKQVRASGFDVCDVDSESAIVGRMLGRCIVEAPKIQAGVQLILENREEQLRAARWTDLTCVTIEALLDRCHAADRGKIYAGEIAKLATVILKGRGDPGGLTGRGVGKVLSDLGFSSKRDGHGFGLRLTANVVHAIHRLARDFRVAAVEDDYSRCAICSETFGNAPKPARASSGRDENPRVSA